MLFIRNTNIDGEPYARECVVTHKGLPITIETFLDVEEDNNGFRIDAFLAKHKGELAGYVKVGYVDRAKMSKFFPKPHELFYYAKALNGWSLDLRPLQAGNLPVFFQSLMRYTHTP